MSMQEMPVDLEGRLFSAVDLIADNRASQKCTMQADLVRTPGQRMEFQQGMRLEALQCFIFRDGFAAAAFRDDGHPFAMAGIATDVRFHAAGRRWWSTIHQ